MAPKARGRGRGRGRGGGRGQATAPQPPSTPRSAAEEEALQENQIDTINRTISQSQYGAQRADPVATTQANDTEMADLEDPSQTLERTEPQSAPVASSSAASAPERPEPQSKPVTSGSATQAQPSSNHPAPTPASRGRARGPQPRAFRRSKEEREALERAEEQRQRERESEARSVANFTNALRGRGRGDWGGGRAGRAGGRAGGNVGSVQAVASGPFSAGTFSADTTKRKRGGALVGGRQSAQNTTSTRNEPSSTSGAQDSSTTGGTSAEGQKSTRGGKKGASRVKKERDAGDNSDEDNRMLGISKVKPEPQDGGYISSDEDAQGEAPRADVARLNINSDEDDQGDTDAKKVKSVKPAIPPALAPTRIRRVDLKERDEASKIRQPSTSTTGKKSAGKGAAQVIEDTDEGEAVQPRRGKGKGKDVEVVDEKPRWQGVYSDSEEAEPKVKEEPRDDDDMDVDTAAPEADASLQEAPPLESRRKLIAEGKKKASSATGPFVTVDDQNEIDTEERNRRLILNEFGIGPDANPDGPPEDRVFLFQLPPDLPELIPADAAVKQEDGGEPVISNPGEGPIKVEDGEEGAASESSLQNRAPGFAGKLRLYKSGRMTLDWGGIPLEVSMGSQASYPQEVLVVKDDQAYSLGQIRGNMVVTPDLDQLFES